MAPFIFWETINLHNYTDSTWLGVYCIIEMPNIAA